MKIIYLRKRFIKGGLERIVIDKMNWLSSHGYEIILVTLSQKNFELPYKLNNVRHIDLNIDFPSHCLNKLKKGVAYFRINQFLKQKLKELIKIENPDIIISLMSTELPLLSKMNLSAKKIAEFHGSNFTFVSNKGFKSIKDRYFINKLKRQLYRYDKFVILNQQEIQYWGNTNCTAIPNFCTFKSDISSSLNNRHVIAVGRLSEQKNYESMFRIWREVYNHFPDWTLDIYGDGHLKSSLEEYANFLDLSSSIKFHGKSNNIKDCYLQSDAIIAYV